MNYNQEQLKKKIRKIPFFDTIRETANGDSIYLVGGSLRNLLLENEAEDWDFIVTGDCEKTAREIARKTRGAFVVLDEKFGIYRVAFKNNCVYLDFSQCRGSLGNDLNLRDFTINALAYNINTDKLTDLHNGIACIEKGIIDVVGENSLRDDPLRILRAYRLKAKLGFSIDSRTESLIHRQIRGLEKVHFERIRDEIYKIFSTHNSAEIMREMYAVGIPDIILPELKPMEGMSQNRFHRYDVLEHSFQALQELENMQKAGFDVLGECREQVESYLNNRIAGQRKVLDTLKFAVLLHDAGKPAVRKVRDGVLYYTGHHIAGKEIWSNVAGRFRLSAKEKKLGARCIEYHLEPVFLPLEADHETIIRNTYDFFRNAGNASPAVVIASWVDVETGRGPALTFNMIDKHHSFSLNLLRSYFNREPVAFPPVFLDGRQIMKELDIGEGRIIGELMDRQKEMSGTGKIKNAEEALEFLRGCIR